MIEGTGQMRSLAKRDAPSGLSALLRGGTATGLCDRELLERFATNRDQGGELAFATLVARHGPMVKSVCHRMLRNPEDAEDAFQATFLVLVRRASSIRLGVSLGPWLYGVSVRVARRARVVGSRRRTVELAGETAEKLSERGSSADHDLRLVIDEELTRIPESFRAPIVLCHMQGLTHEEAADRLQCPIGTVRSRLARGRALLKNRLERSRWGTIAGSCACPDLNEPSSAVTYHLIDHSARIASRYAAGEPLATIVSAGVASLVTGVTRGMTISKSIIMCSLLLFAGAAAIGVSRLAAQTQGGNLPAPQQTSTTTAPPVSTIALQATPDASRKSRTPRADTSSRVDAALLADFPPVVIDVVPELGAVNVDPGLREVRITFSKKMTDRSWSLTEGNKYAVPRVHGAIHYDRDQRTCVIPVELEPGKTYVWGVNSERFRNFKDTDGRPALPYLIVFRTRSAR
jgi:RNA polymerase sigma factor (sigma-70 family)